MLAQMSSESASTRRAHKPGRTGHSGGLPGGGPLRRLLDGLAAGLLGRWPGRLFLCGLAGTLLFLACADFDIWPLAWIGMVPLLWVLLDEHGQPRTQRPFLYGMVTGLVANGGGFYWIIGLLMRFGHMPFVAALPLFLLLVGYQAITFGLFASLLCRLRGQLGVNVTFLAPLCWVACELCVPYVFPWYLAITQAWVPPVIQVADFAGPLGVSFLLVLASGALFDLGYALLRERPTRRLRGALGTPLLAATLIAMALAYGTLRIHQVDRARAAADKLKVGVVQANVGIHEKFVPGLREQQHALHLRLSQELTQKGAELIVWPESSYPYPIARPPQRDFPVNDLRRVQRGFDTPILFGALTYERQSDGDIVPYNTAVMLDRDGRVVGSFDKNFLLIFGEYLPFARELAFLRQLIPEISNFARGTSTTTFPLQAHGRTYYVGPMICYEDIIPAFGRRLFADKNPPNLLVNITNDAWFGATSEPYEHLALAVYRAVEHREDLVRAVNTGVSAFIDAAGRVRQKGPSVDPQLTPGAPPVTLLGEMALLPPGGLYQQLGETFGGTCFVLVLLLALLARQRAGWPVRWGVLLAATAALHLLVLVGGFVLGGSLEAVRATYAALLHRNEAAVAEAALFAATWRLIVILLLATTGIAVLVGRRLGRRESKSAPTPGQLELFGAIALTTILPVVLFGRMEGNTGAVVIAAGLCVAVALPGLRLGARLHARR
jgi:apolipoprotein N-acyltransferase